MSAAEQMKISAQQAALAAGNAVLRGEGDGTYSEAEDVIRLLIAVLTQPSTVSLQIQVLRWCDHVERSVYVRDSVEGQLDAAPHILASYARKLAMIIAGHAALSAPGAASVRDWWTVLELPSRDATRRDVDAAYRQLALKHHPDAAGTRGAWDDLVAAYEIAKLECSP